MRVGLELEIESHPVAEICVVVPGESQGIYSTYHMINHCSHDRVIGILEKPIALVPHVKIRLKIRARVPTAYIEWLLADVFVEVLLVMVVEIVQ